MSYNPDPTTSKNGEKKCILASISIRRHAMQLPLTKKGEVVDRREFKNEREEWEKFVEGIPRDSKVAIETS